MFGKDLSRILDLGDPEEMARRLDELDRKMEQAQASYEQLEQAAEGMRITETDPAGVSATVNVDGQLTELVTTPQITRLTPEQIGPTILACITRAQSRIADRYREAAEQTGSNDDMTRHVIESYRQRYPAPEPEDPRPETSRTMRLGQLEDD
ncbi:YbaB/EbfC family nucleoid-associated protein [Lentzea alba]|uniref:YbaB/EbfC family nucleoid-associated protein n=1 Tax=Lentzea alba TaxID=2714351 RepID=UPI0039BF7966